MKALRVGIIGCGFVSKFNVRAWEFLGHKVVGVCDLNRDLAENLAIEIKAKPYSDYLAMAQKENLDAVSVCTPPSSHYRILRGLTSLSHKLKIVVEKPFTITSNQAVVFRNSKRVAVLHTQLYSSFYFEALKLVRRGLVGKVFEVNINTMTTPKDYMTVDPQNWSHKLRGGRIAECLSHPVYLAQAFCSQNDLVVKDARAFKPIIASVKHLSFSELFAVLQGREVRATVNVRLNMPCESVATVDVVGEKGVLKAGIVPSGITFLLYSGKPKIFKREKFMFSRVRIIREFLDGNCPMSADHAYHNVRIVETLIDKIVKVKEKHGI